MAKASFTVSQSKRIGESVRWFEAHGRNKLGDRKDYGGRRDGLNYTSIGSDVTFKITGNETVNAMYTAKTFTDSAGGTISLSGGTLTDASFGTLATSNNAIIINTLEAYGFSNSGHDVTNTSNTFSTVATGRIVDSRTDSTLIIHAAIPFTYCRP